LATNYIPTYTDGVSVAAYQTLARGSIYRTTLDLRAGQTNACIEAYLGIEMGRGGTTAISGGNGGVEFRIRRMNNNGAAGLGGRHPFPIFPIRSQTAAATFSTTINVTSAAGNTEIKTVNVTGAAVGDIICIQDSDGGVTRVEFATISKLTVASGTGVTLDAPLLYTHTSGLPDTVRNASDVWSPPALLGGSLYEIIVDYGGQSAGDNITFGIFAQLLTGFSS